MEWYSTFLAIFENVYLLPIRYIFWVHFLKVGELSQAPKKEFSKVENTFLSFQEQLPKNSKWKYIEIFLGAHKMSKLVFALVKEKQILFFNFLFILSFEYT